MLYLSYCEEASTNMSIVCHCSIKQSSLSICPRMWQLDHILDLFLDFHSGRTSLYSHQSRAQAQVCTYDGKRTPRRPCQRTVYSEKARDLDTLGKRAGWIHVVVYHWLGQEHWEHFICILRSSKSQGKETYAVKEVHPGMFGGQIISNKLL